MTTNNATCLMCGNHFYAKPSHLKLGWGKYCSLTCRHKSQIKGNIYNCAICKKLIHRTPTQEKRSRSKNFFCSKNCQTYWRNKYFIEEKHSNWQNGQRTYRNILIRSKAKQTCALCGTVNKLVLTAHHKDHNRKNNHLENLIWLCLNCHFLVHHSTKLDNKIQKYTIT